MWTTILNHSDSFGVPDLIPVTKRQREGNADALYAFKSRGFGREAGLVTS